MIGRLSIVIVTGGVGAGGEDSDAVLPAADVAADALPGAVAGHAGRVGPLMQDKHHVGRAVVVEAGGDGEHAGPVVAAHQVGEPCLELVVQFAEPVRRADTVRRATHRGCGGHQAPTAPSRAASAAARIAASWSCASQTGRRRARARDSGGQRRWTARREPGSRRASPNATMRASDRTRGELRPVPWPSPIVADNASSGTVTPSGFASSQSANRRPSRYTLGPTTGSQNC